MDYIEKLELQTEEIQEVENLEKHKIIISDPFSVNKYKGHADEFLAIDGEFNDGFNQLNKANGSVVNCIVSKRVNEIKNNLSVSVKDFGAKGNGTSDDTKAIRDAFNYAIENNKGVFFPSGEFICNEKLNIVSGLNVAGCGVNSSIKYTGVDSLFEIQENASNWVIKDLKMTGNDKGCGIKGLLCYEGIIDNCNIQHFQHGIYFTIGWSYYITNCVILRNIDTGIALASERKGCLNAITIEKNVIEYNKVGVLVGNGVLSIDDTTYSGNTVWIKHNTIQVNNTSQVEINDYINVTVQDNYLESYKYSDQSCILVGKKGVSSPTQIFIYNNTISRYNDFPYTGITIEKVYSSVIEGNTFWSGVNDYDININQDNVTKDCVIKKNNKRRNMINSLMSDIKIFDEPYCMSYSNRELPLLLNDEWIKVCAAEIIEQHENKIKLNGIVINENLTNNVIGNLPYRFRPKEKLKFITAVDKETAINYNSPVVYIFVYPSGDITAWSCDSSNGSFAENVKIEISLNGIEWTI